MKYVKNSLKFIVQNMTNLSTLNSCKICSTCPILDFFSPKFIKNVEFLQNTKKLYNHAIEMGDSIFFSDTLYIWNLINFSTKQNIAISKIIF